MLHALAGHVCGAELPDMTEDKLYERFAKRLPDTEMTHKYTCAHFHAAINVRAAIKGFLMRRQMAEQLDAFYGALRDMQQEEPCASPDSHQGTTASCAGGGGGKERQPASPAAGRGRSGSGSSGAAPDGLDDSAHRNSASLDPSAMASLQSALREVAADLETRPSKRSSALSPPAESVEPPAAWQRLAAPVQQLVHILKNEVTALLQRPFANNRADTTMEPFGGQVGKSQQQQQLPQQPPQQQQAESVAQEQQGDEVGGERPTDLVRSDPQIALSPTANTKPAPGAGGRDRL